MSAVSSSPSPSSERQEKSRRGRNRVTAEHTLSRVRENQRRHRARRRDHIAELEDKLKETERLLEEARREVATLREERDECRKQRNCVNVAVKEAVSLQSNNSLEFSQGGEDIQGLELATLDILPNSDLLDEQRIPVLAAAEEPNSFLYTLDIASLNPQPMAVPAGPPPCCTDTPFSAPSSNSLSEASEMSEMFFDPTVISDPTNRDCITCSTRPAPAPTESTTLCAQAYILIAQQNFKGIDATTIRFWLDEGFRRAKRRGEGCSVENGALLRVLDFISGV